MQILKNSPLKTINYIAIEWYHYDQSHHSYHPHTTLFDRWLNKQCNDFEEMHMN